MYLGKPDGLNVLIESVAQGILSAEASKVALSSIAQLGSNDAVPFIGQKLHHPTPSSNPPNTDLTEAMVRGLVSVGSVEAISQIVQMLTQPNTDPKLRGAIEIMIEARNLQGEALKVIETYKGTGGAPKAS